MKKIFGIVLISASLVACNEAGQDNSIRSEDSSVLTAPEETTVVYTPAEGDVRYNGNKLEVMRNGEWVTADDDITLENGTVVYRDGRVKRDDKEIELEDGEIVDRTGNFFDRTGHAIENAWGDAKQGVKDAGKEIEK